MKHVNSEGRAVRERQPSADPFWGLAVCYECRSLFPEEKARWIAVDPSGENHEPFCPDCWGEEGKEV